MRDARVTISAAVSLLFLWCASLQAKDVSVRAETVDCPKRTCLIFTGVLPKEKRPDKPHLIGAELVLNNHVVSEVSGTSYTLQYRVTDPGDYLVRVRGIFRDGNRMVVQRGFVRAHEDAACGLQFRSVRMIDLDKVEFVPASKPPTSSISFYFTKNGETYGPYRSEPKNGTYVLTLPISDFGDVGVYAEAVADGCQYISPDYRITSYNPIALTVDKNRLDVDKGETTLRLNIRLDGVKSTSARLLADDRCIANLDIHEGDNPLEVDVSRVLSKVYSFSAAFRRSRVEVRSPAVDVEISNRGEDDRTSMAGLYRSKIDETRTLREKLASRRKLLGLAASVLGTKIGRPEGLEDAVRGLCVATQGIWEITGEVMKITLSVSPSRTRLRELVWQNKSVDVKAQVSLANAVQVAERYIRRTNPEFRADDYRYTVKCGKGEKIRGDSAGAALALLLISHFTHQPIRSDIAITGAIEQDGTIGEVGGYSMKSDAAFEDPNVTTLIIPSTTEAIFESTQVPEFILTHRVIAARTIDEAARHALIGKDVEWWMCEAEWLAALAAFSKGQTTVALTYLGEIRKTVPEDFTAHLWYNWLSDEAKLTATIAENERWADDFIRRNPRVLEVRDDSRNGFVVLAGKSAERGSP